jgi:hypothetical protein
MLDLIFTKDDTDAWGPEMSEYKGRLIIGLDLGEILRLVAVGTREDCPVPFLLDRRSFRSKEGLQRYFAAHASDENCIVAITQCPDPHDLVKWLLRQELTIDSHAHPGWSSRVLKLSEERELWDIPRAYDTAYALAFLSSYRQQAERVACMLWNQTYNLDEILKEFKGELERLSHALQPMGLLEPKLKGYCPF